MFGSDSDNAGSSISSEGGRSLSNESSRGTPGLRLPPVSDSDSAAEASILESIMTSGMLTLARSLAVLLSDDAISEVFWDGCAESVPSTSAPGEDADLLLKEGESSVLTKSHGEFIIASEDVRLCRVPSRPQSCQYGI